MARFVPLAVFGSLTAWMIAAPAEGQSPEEVLRGKGPQRLGAVYVLEGEVEAGQLSKELTALQAELEGAERQRRGLVESAAQDHAMIQNLDRRCGALLALVFRDKDGKPDRLAEADRLFRF